MSDHYRGRFAPSPTGPLHLGSMACAMASFLDARAHGGAWLIRIEDIDPPRDIPGADKDIIDTLGRFHLSSDEPILWQHDRYDRYQAAFDSLVRDGRVYGCSCTRSQIKARSEELGLPGGIYPGTCRSGASADARSWRFRTDAEPIAFVDRACGPYTQSVEKEVGDFVLKRADGLWAYQLAVVVDDADQGMTHIVRGRDLLDNTPRQIALQRALGVPTPSYLHIDLVLNKSGQKLSKQQGAARVPTEAPLSVLEALWLHLGGEKIGADSLDAFWSIAAQLWGRRYAR